MDNICHTLVGAALGETGLKRRTRLGNATLMIAANLPDLDVLVYATSTPAVVFRRGWTHGVLAQVTLPLLLTLVMVAWARWRPAPRDEPPVSLGWLVAFSYLGVYSHVFLDFLNNYGVRLLMPLERRWFYGDTLFIIDPWLWGLLGAGVWRARRLLTPRPARIAVAIACVYIGLMLGGARAAHQVVTDTWTRTTGAPPAALMVGPRPVSPFTRDVILDAGDRYVTGTFSWISRSVTFADEVPKIEGDPLVQQARRNPAIASFLVWSRFPAWTVVRGADTSEVSVSDLRFRPLRAIPGSSRFEVAVTVANR